MTTRAGKKSDDNVYVVQSELNYCQLKGRIYTLAGDTELSATDIYNNPDYVAEWKYVLDLRANDYDDTYFKIEYFLNSML